VAHDPDRFVDTAVGISLSKPPAWSFLPTAWSPMALMKRRPVGEAQEEWAKLAQLPICCAQARHPHRRYPFPTLQVVARVSARPEHRGRAELLTQLAASLASAHGFAVDASSSDAYLCGRPGLYLRGRFVLVSRVEGEDVRMRILSRIHVAFHRGFALTIGLSGAENKRYFDESDFDAILASVSLD
jgi:hypothetical protein